MNASMSSRKTSLGFPNGVALRTNMVLVLDGKRTVKNEDFVIAIIIKFLKSCTTVPQLCNNAIHRQRFLRIFMTPLQTVQSHPASVDAYIRHGWSLVPIPMGTKGPRTPNWNLKENALKSQSELPAGFGIGLAHAYSGTMALDIDNWLMATTVLADHGIDLQALYDASDAVGINSGKQGRSKLLYAMPFGAVLPTKKITHNNVTVYELRCATANGLTVQDVLPPSIHPETQQSYTWVGKGHWTRLPVIPQALLDVWQSLLSQDKERTIETTGTFDTSWDEIRQAVEFIPADCAYDEWVNVGMALHWAGTQTDQVDQGLILS
jgi:hypothetical protein